MATTRKATKMMGARKMAAAGERGGFTIIEVVLVLAIAGLIFLMVFIALPALQRSQRDTQRRENMSALQTAVTNYQGNNNGKLPADGVIAAAEEGTGSIEFKSSGSGGISYNGGTSANSAVSLIYKYLNAVNATENKFVDPTGHAYGLTIMTLGSSSSGNTMEVTGTDYDNHMAYIIKHAKCDGEKSVYSANARDYTIMLKLEGSGTYCQSNS